MPLEQGTTIADLNPLWPTGNDPKSQGDDHIRLMKAVMGNIYPVGAIYTSVVATEPSTLFGGTWVPFQQDRTLVSAGGAYAAGTTGGAATVALTEAQLASHDHTDSFSVSIGTDSAPNHQHFGSLWASAAGTGGIQDVDVQTSGGASSRREANTMPGGARSHSHTASVNGKVNNAGSGQAHNNMMPYVAVYMWERTA